MESYLDAKILKREFARVKEIGAGSDGSVDLYSHRLTPGKSIVVKYTRSSGDETEDTKNPPKNPLRHELQMMKKLHRSSHENIVKCLGWDENWSPHGPALFYEYCPLGDLYQYRQKLAKDLKATTGSPRIPEQTLWKFFADMTKALHHLSTTFPTPIIHGDLKPDNILVVAQHPQHPYYTTANLPTLPLFKLADFSRASQPIPGTPFPFPGTYAYAIPMEERPFATPNSDIFSLGATLQFLAYGQHPTQRMADFLTDLREVIGSDAVDALSGQDLQSDYWAKRIPVVYRPLDASVGEQVRGWGVRPDCVIGEPYGRLLGVWYGRCLEFNRLRRVDVGGLVKGLVPLAGVMIEVLGIREVVGRLEREVECGGGGGERLEELERDGI